jgi:hypothetical protein
LDPCCAYSGAFVARHNGFEGVQSSMKAYACGKGSAHLLLLVIMVSCVLARSVLFTELTVLGQVTTLPPSTEQIT